jgi:hypothetical protein
LQYSSAASIGVANSPASNVTEMETGFFMATF